MLSWKGPTGIIKSNSWVCKGPLKKIIIIKKSDRMSESIVQMLIELWQVRCHDHSPRESVPVPDHSLGEDFIAVLWSEGRLLIKEIHFPSRWASYEEHNKGKSSSQQKEPHTCMFTFQWLWTSSHAPKLAPSGPEDPVRSMVDTYMNGTFCSLPC